MNEQLLAEMIAAVARDGRAVVAGNSPMVTPFNVCALGALYLARCEDVEPNARVTNERGFRALEDQGFSPLFLAGVNDGFEEDDSGIVVFGYRLRGPDSDSYSELKARVAADVQYQYGQELGAAFREAFA